LGATHAAVLLLSLLSCVTVLAGVALALRLRENARARRRHRLPGRHHGPRLAARARPRVVPEGFAMANAYVASPALGVLVGLAIALHNVPEEFAMAVPLVMLRSKASLYRAAARLLPLGVVLSVLVYASLAGLTALLA